MYEFGKNNDQVLRKYIGQEIRDPDYNFEDTCSHVKLSTGSYEYFRCFFSSSSANLEIYLLGFVHCILAYCAIKNCGFSLYTIK